MHSIWPKAIPFYCFPSCFVRQNARHATRLFLTDDAPLYILVQVRCVCVVCVCVCVMDEWWWVRAMWVMCVRCECHQLEQCSTVFAVDFAQSRTRYMEYAFCSCNTARYCCGCSTANFGVVFGIRTHHQSYGKLLATTIKLIWHERNAHKAGSFIYGHTDSTK